MEIIAPTAFKTQAWKNGGGITHEIAREEDAGQILWRLSIAEVTSDGPFSAFPGLARILTVIDGAGLYLDAEGTRLSALPLKPCTFPGQLAPDCHCIDGPVRDLNLIYDPTRIAGAVTSLGSDTSHCCAKGRYAAFALGQGTDIDGKPLPEGAVAIFGCGTLRTSISPALLIHLDPV